jgi:hypothetical protein
MDWCQPSAWADGIPDPYLCGCPKGQVCNGGDGGPYGSCNTPTYQCVPESDAGDGGADGPPSGNCAGECVPFSPNGWDFPSQVYIGPEFNAPQCPPTAIMNGYEGHAELNAPPIACGQCQCNPPSGSCGLPATITASSAVCPGTVPGATPTPFDPPAGWDGGCTTNDAVPAGQVCDGGPCVASITIAPLTINEMGCTPTQLPIPTNGPVSWGNFARTCRAITAGGCTGGALCVPPLAPGFRWCVYQQGDVSCYKLGPYQDRYVFYDDYQDTRDCTSCACGAPSGSTCSASISVYTDGACASMPPLEEVTVTSAAPSCHDVPAGSALGSKAAGPATYSPGACQPSGGDPIGAAVPINPSTICCLPSP